MTLIHIAHILLLAVVQGLAELLPVSSSAHVTVAARLMRFEAGSSFEWAFLLVMLHTGTMFSVLVYFWRRWKDQFRNLPVLLAATVCTGVIALGLKKGIEHFFLHDEKIETLFQNLPLIAASLAIVGIIIVGAGLKERRRPGRIEGLSWAHGLIMGVVQGVCLPFRGFSRSGSTISTGLFLGIARMRAEDYSFALAVLLTPAVIAWEGREVVNHYREATAKQQIVDKDGNSNQSAATVRLSSAAADKDHSAAERPSLGQTVAASAVGMCLSFVAGLAALRWLSRWLEQGHWTWFGYYCLAASCAVVVIHFTVPPVS